jgi:hypothetical protein
MIHVGVRGLLEVAKEVPQGEKLGASSTHHEVVLFRSVLMKAGLHHVAHLLMTSKTN